MTIQSMEQAAADDLERAIAAHAAEPVQTLTRAERERLVRALEAAGSVLMSIKAKGLPFAQARRIEEARYLVAGAHQIVASPPPTLGEAR